MVMRYDPDRKPMIEITSEVKSRLQELKKEYHLKSFSEVIELLLNEKYKKQIEQKRPSVNPPQNLFCPDCGQKIEGKPRFCRMCGNRL